MAIEYPEAWPAPVRRRVRERWLALTAADARYDCLAPPLRERLLRLIAISDFAAGFCHRSAEVFFDELETPGRLSRRYDLNDVADTIRQHLMAATDEAALSRELRRIRQREMFLIAWSDLSDLSSVEQTLANLSALADLLIDAALGWLYADQCRQMGVPRNASGERQRLVVIGMGKLGGRELNFSSDIDLIFFFPDKGSTDGRRPVANEQFFTRLGQRLIRSLDANTADGFVFRVDMRLRPFGESGALTPSRAAMEAYYPLHGRDWERYALIKARIVAGDRAAGESLLANLRGFVYRRYLDYTAIESLREMKAMIAREAARKYHGDNLKLGMGGIREVEFIAQLFQLIHGGRDRRLRQTGLQPVLQYLGERGLLPAEVVQALLAAYRFLRKAENTLQMLRDQQTHVLPDSDEDRWRLALATGFEDWQRFHAALAQHRQVVREHFDALFSHQKGDEREATQDTPLATLWQVIESTQDDERDAWLAVLAGSGFRQPERVLETLQALVRDRRIQALSPQGRRRLDRLMPRVLTQALETGYPDETLERLATLISAIAGRTVYLSLMLERPQVLARLTRLCAASPWFRDYVARHPILLDSLIEPNALSQPPDKATMQQALHAELERLDPGDEEQLLDRLRNFKQLQVFRVAAADVLGILPVMKVSDHLTWLAEVMLETAAEAAWTRLVERFGEPCCERDGQPQSPHLLVIGYGKLGGLEMGYGSDLDLVFVHDSCRHHAFTTGASPVHNNVFFARLGQRLIHLLSVMTPAGRVYEIDMRLRPGGASGPLAPSLEAYHRYLKTEAWTWELQALVRARAIVGPPALQARFAEIRDEVLRQPRDPASLRREVVAMREKMRRHHRLPSLARISHRGTTATAQCGALTGVHSVGLLDAVSTTPARPSVANASHHTTLSGLATRPCEKSGLGSFDLKMSPGGIVDLEFVVQYLVLAHAAAHPGLTRWSDNVRILGALAEAGVLEASLAAELAEAYRRLRDEMHKRKLNDLPAIVEPGKLETERRLVRDCWQRFLGSDSD